MTTPLQRVASTGQYVFHGQRSASPGVPDDASAHTVPSDSAPDVGPEETHADLLDTLTARSDAYRDLKLVGRPEATAFRPRIAFDTVSNDTEDERPFDDYPRGRGRSPSPSHVSPLSSPGGGDFLSARSSYGLVRMLSPRRPEYPTTPITTRKGCTYTAEHRDYDALYQGRLRDATGAVREPVLRHRVILVYVSGRKHTWVALDWVLNQFVEDGDSVIVVSAIPRGFASAPSRVTAQPGVPLSPRMRLRQRHRADNLRVIARDLMTYMRTVVKPHVIARLVVELTVGDTKNVLKDMYRLYEPNVVCTGTKPTALGAPLKSWLSSKLTDRMVKNFPLPVIVVPAVNMSEFELGLAGAPSDDTGRPCGPGPASPATASAPASEPPSESELDSDVASINSDSSYSSYDEISRLYSTYKRTLHADLRKARHCTFDDTYFSRFLTTISDKSIEFCQEVRDVQPDFKGRGAKLARAITGSNSFGAIPYKTKSLLAPVESPPPKPPSGSTGLSYKELKRLTTQKRASASGSPPPPPPPKIDVSEASPTPRSSTIKFGDLEAPARKGSPPTNLHKSRSYEGDSKVARPRLEPLKSHPDITNVLGDASPEPEPKKTKKRGKFWKLFK
ncbi:UspA domain-containing protein [[Candida] zeylanoides]